MKKNIKIFFGLVGLFFVQMIYSQVGIGTTSPDESSILDIESANKGVLVPRLSNNQISTISNPASGHLWPLLNHEILDLQIVNLRFCSIVGEKSEP